MCGYRADHQSVGIAGPAPLTNGGTAMLVMRNFGYLGLHNVVHNRSSLARKRLVNMSGDLQLRLKAPEEQEEVDDDGVSSVGGDDVDDSYVVDRGFVGFHSEATTMGGRNVVAIKTKGTINGDEQLEQDRKGSSSGTTSADESGVDEGNSHLYAQEVGPVSLQEHKDTSMTLSSPTRVRGRSRQVHQSTDAEPLFLSSFCNNMLVSLGELDNLGKGRIVVKVELREMSRLKDGSGGWEAHRPANSPCIYNQRRGPFLVHDIFSSCAEPTTRNNQGDRLKVSFTDEFKMKLPLVLPEERQLALFVSLYSVDLKPKRGWIGKRAVNLLARKVAAASATDDQESTASGADEEDNGPKVEFVSCGFLLIQSALLPAHLIDGGTHEIDLSYRIDSRTGNQTGATTPLTTKTDSSDTPLIVVRDEPKTRGGAMIHVSDDQDNHDEFGLLPSPSTAEEDESGHSGSERLVIDTDEMLEGSAVTETSLDSFGPLPRIPNESSTFDSASTQRQYQQQQQQQHQHQHQQQQQQHPDYSTVTSQRSSNREAQYNASKLKVRVLQ